MKTQVLATLFLLVLVLGVESKRVHMIGLFHTITDSAHSHCAYTAKVLKFARMMQDQGWYVTEYGNVRTESGANKFIPLLSGAEFARFGPKPVEANTNSFVGDSAMIGSELHKLFESRLIKFLKDEAFFGDIVCHPFGHAHAAILPHFTHVHHVESGIGYPETFLNRYPSRGDFRIFESFAWMHWHAGKAQSHGNGFNWVVPNYFNVSEWKISPKSYPRKGDVDQNGPIVYMGRITKIKGMEVISALAETFPNRTFRIAGQGNFTQFFAGMRNVFYDGVLEGNARDKFLDGAYCMLMPTTFIEPFGGAGVEAQLKGIPLIASNWGGFTETIQNGKSGYRCNTYTDWVAAIKAARFLDRRYIARRARALYSTETIGKKYNDIFMTISQVGLLETK